MAEQVDEEVMMRKILFVALKYSYGVKAYGEALNKKALYDNFVALGYEVEAVWSDEYEKERLQQVLLESARRFDPDMIFFKLFKDEVTLETLDTLRNEYFTVNWFGDDQWRFETFTAKYANHFDACITTDKFAVDKYRQIGQNDIIRSQHASFENESPYTDVESAFEVSFVGGVSAYRRWFVQALEKQGIEVACFGNGWENGRVPYARMDELFLTSKINLNISNSTSYDIRYLLANPRNLLSTIKAAIVGGKGVSQTKARIFEIPVRGGFEITEYVPSLEEYFEIGKEMVCYSSVDEAAVQIRYYLEHDEEREAIKKASVLRARTEHTYRHRVTTFMERLRGYYAQKRSI